MSFCCFRFLAPLLASAALGFLLIGGCASVSPGDTPAVGGYGAASAHRESVIASSEVNKDTPTWVVFPDRKDLPQSEAVVRDPTFRVAIPIFQSLPSISGLCPQGKYRAWVMFVVEPDGSVRDAKVIETSGEPMVDAACVECVRKWRFRPGTLHGVPIPSATEVPFHVGVGTHYNARVEDLNH